MGQESDNTHKCFLIGLPASEPPGLCVLNLDSSDLPDHSLKGSPKNLHLIQLLGSF